MSRKNPFRHHRFPKDVILLAVRWYCRYPLSYRDVRDLLAERGINIDAATIYRRVQKFGPEIRKRAYGQQSYRWRAVDQCGQLINFRLTARRNANAARAFMRQASDTVRCYQPIAIVTSSRALPAKPCRARDRAQSYAKVIEEMNYGNGPDDRIRHVDRKHLNNRIEANHAALKQVLRPKRNFRKLTAAKNTLNRIETYRAIKKGHFANNETGVLNEIAFVGNLFKKAA